MGDKEGRQKKLEDILRTITWGDVLKLRRFRGKLLGNPEAAFFVYQQLRLEKDTPLALEHFHKARQHNRCWADTFLYHLCVDGYQIPEEDRFSEALEIRSKEMRYDAANDARLRSDYKFALVKSLITPGCDEPFVRLLVSGAAYWMKGLYAEHRQTLLGLLYSL